MRHPRDSVGKLIQRGTKQRMKRYLMILLAGAMQASCNTATGVSELSAVQGEWQLTVIERNDGTTV